MDQNDEVKFIQDNVYLQQQIKLKCIIGKKSEGGIELDKICKYPVVSNVIESDKLSIIQGICYDLLKEIFLDLKKIDYQQLALYLRRSDGSQDELFGKISLNLLNAPRSIQAIFEILPTKIGLETKRVQLSARAIKLNIGMGIPDFYCDFSFFDLPFNGNDYLVMLNNNKLAFKSEIMESTSQINGFN